MFIKYLIPHGHIAIIFSHTQKSTFEQNRKEEEMCNKRDNCIMKERKLKDVNELDGSEASRRDNYIEEERKEGETNLGITKGY